MTSIKQLDLDGGCQYNTPKDMIIDDLMWLQKRNVCKWYAKVRKVEVL